MNDWLVQQPPEEDVKEALLSFKAGKAPGPDGFTVGFFQKF